MAKVTAPLLSFRGSGQIGKAVVFGRWRGIEYARQHVTPSNPQTTAQQTTRTTFATLREMWKLNDALGRAPWDAFASGRKFLGLNSFIGENLRVVRGDPLFTDFIGSPGARGGLPPDSVTAAAGVASGEVDLTFTNPTPPPGWTLNAEVGIAFPDQDPSLVFGGPLVTEESSPPTGTVTLGGLGSGVSVVTAGWLEWLKPNGETAYSVGVTNTATTAV